MVLRPENSLNAELRLKYTCIACAVRESTVVVVCVKSINRVGLCDSFFNFATRLSAARAK